MYISGYSSSKYMTGMASGMDIDAMVKNLMNAERVPYDQHYVKMQYHEWQLKAYQESTKGISDFQKKYFDYLNESTNMLSSSTYLNYEFETSNESIDVSISDSKSVKSSYQVEVHQLATPAYVEGHEEVSSSVLTKGFIDYDELDGCEFKLTLDGSEKLVTINDLDGIDGISMDDVQLSIDACFGSGKIEVAEDHGKLMMDTVKDSGVHQLKVKGEAQALEKLGFSEGSSFSNYVDQTMSLADLSSQLKTPFTFDVDGMINISINQQMFSFSSDTSIEHVLETINNDSDANVTMTYDPIHDQFELKSDQTGTGTNLMINEVDSNFLSSVGLNTVVEGSDAQVTVDGDLLVRSDNTIVYGGISIACHRVSDEPTMITSHFDDEKMLSTIKTFIEGYNMLVKELQQDLKEERDYDFSPLTQDQKNDMSDDEVESWEEEAKMGLLSRDSILESMLNDMRQQLYEEVEGCGLSLSEIGISTESYESGNILTIDEEKLKGIIEQSPEVIIQLFTQPSKDYPGTSSVRGLANDELSIRQKQEGLMYRLYDVTEKYISSVSDANGNKGILLEKCGMSNDYTQLNSSMYQQLASMKDQLLEMEERLEAKEASYYKKFSMMETNLSKMSSQIQMVQSWFSG